MDKREYMNEDVEAQSEKMVETSEKQSKIEETKPMSQRVSPSKKPITVKVIGCSRLAVREYPDPDAEVATIVNKDDILKIAPDYQHKMFSKILFKGGEVGYAMTKYLETVK